jgi:hypothetical protein
VFMEFCAFNIELLQDLWCANMSCEFPNVPLIPLAREPLHLLPKRKQSRKIYCSFYFLISILNRQKFVLTTLFDRILGKYVKINLIFNNDFYFFLQFLAILCLSISSGNMDRLIAKTS